MLMSMIAAEIVEYDDSKRQATIKIDGLTDGATTYPIADLLYSLGDDPSKTEIELLSGDKVWIVFQGGDTRKPIIVGFRCPQTNNVTRVRRWHKENIELLADEQIKFHAPAILAICDNLTIEVTDSTNITTNSLTVTGNTTFNSPVTFNDGANVAGGDFAVDNGSISIPNGDMVIQDIGFIDHYHTVGGVNSSPPIGG